jgi:predicted Holliday junction resolvase-like endonuclease
MNFYLGLWIFLIGIIGGLMIGISIVHKKAVRPLRTKIREIEEHKRSLSSIYGRITEQYAPFMKKYPFNPHKFRFIGEPIDGIQFEDDKIIFIEFKARRGVLNPRQKMIKKMVQTNKISWYEFILEE